VIQAVILVLITSCFIYIFDDFQEMQNDKILMEKIENNKFRFFFNQMQEAIFIVRNDVIQFINPAGWKLYPMCKYSERYDQKQELRSKKMIYEQKRFFIFMNLQSDGVENLI